MFRLIIAAGACLALLSGPVRAAPDRVGEAQGVLFVANKAEGSVSRVRLGDGREERRAGTCDNPHELALSPDGAHLAVGCYSGETIEILAAADLSPVANIALDKGARPHGLVAAETQLSKIAEIDFASGKLLGRLAGGVGGDGLAILGLDGG